MDHDDLLPAHALFWGRGVHRRASGRARSIYSDEDKVDEQRPPLRPVLQARTGTSTCSARRTCSAIWACLSTRSGARGRRLPRRPRRFAGLGSGAALHRAHRAEPDRHVPRVLYHWRVHGESTAKSMDAKPYAAMAGERALNEHFARSGVQAQGGIPGLRLSRALCAARRAAAGVHRHSRRATRTSSCASASSRSSPRRAMRPTKSCWSTTARTIRLRWITSRRSGGAPGHPRVRDDRPVQLCGAQQRSGRRMPNGELVALVNNDIEVTHARLAVRDGQRSRCSPASGAVGARLWYPNMPLQHAGVILGVGGIAGHSHRGMPAGREGYGGRAALIQSFSAVTAACLVVRRWLYRQVGGLERALAECLQRHRLLPAPARGGPAQRVDAVRRTDPPRIGHARQRSVSPEHRRSSSARIAYMQQRWGDAAHDPAYSPNLMLDREDFSYAWPPRLAPRLMALGISVALCTRNGARYLAEQVRSICTQDACAAADRAVGRWVERRQRRRGACCAQRCWRRRASDRIARARKRPPLGVTRNFEQAVRACAATDRAVRPGRRVACRPARAHGGAVRTRGPICCCCTPTRGWSMRGRRWATRCSMRWRSSRPRSTPFTRGRASTCSCGATW